MISGTGQHLADGVSLLRPEEQVFSATLAEFAKQRLAQRVISSRAG